MVYIYPPPLLRPLISLGHIQLLHSKINVNEMEGTMWKATLQGWKRNKIEQVLMPKASLLILKYMNTFKLFLLFWEQTLSSYIKAFFTGGFQFLKMARFRGRPLDTGSVSFSHETFFYLQNQTEISFPLWRYNFNALWRNFFLYHLLNKRK